MVQSEDFEKEEKFVVEPWGRPYNFNFGIEAGDAKPRGAMDALKI